MTAAPCEGDTDSDLIKLIHFTNNDCTFGLTTSDRGGHKQFEIASKSTKPITGPKNKKRKFNDHEVTKSNVGETITEEIVDHKISMKLNPSLFCEMIQDLTIPQKEWVKNSGFGSILNFKLQDYPRYLGYSIAKQFDPEKCSIVVGDKTLEITEDDVHRVLGLPMGETKIAFVSSKSLSKEWRKQFGDQKKSFRVAVKDVICAMKESGCYFFLDKFIGWRCFPSKIQPRFVPWNNYCLQSLEQYMIQKGYITDGVVQKPNINYIELQICRIKGTEVLTGQPELQDLPKMENTKTCSYGATTLGPSENVTGLDFDWNTLPKDSHNGKEWKNSILNNHQTNLGTNADDTTHTQIPFGINLESGQKFQNDAQKRKSSAVGKEKEETSKLGEDKTKLFHQYTSDDKGKMIMNKHSLLESLFDSYHCIQQTLMSHIMSAKAEDEKDEVVDDLRYAFIELNNDANDIMLK